MVTYLRCPNCYNINFNLSEAFQEALKCKYCGTVFFPNGRRACYHPVSHAEEDTWPKTLLDQRLEAEAEQHQKNIAQIEQAALGESTSLKMRLREPDSIPYLDFAQGCAGLAFIGGLFISSGEKGILHNLLFKLFAGGIFAVCGLLIGFILCLIINIVRDTVYSSRLSHGTTSIEQTKNNQLANLDIQHQSAISQINQGYQRAKENALQQMRNAASTRIISNLILDEIDISLESTDRRNHIQALHVSFWFHIYRDYINIWSSQYIAEAASIESKQYELSRRCVILNSINIQPLSYDEQCDALAEIITGKIQEKYGSLGNTVTVHLERQGARALLHLDMDNPERVPYYGWG